MKSASSAFLMALVREIESRDDLLERGEPGDPVFFSTNQSNSPRCPIVKKQTKCLLAISSRCAFAASADVPQKDVIIEADSLGTVEGLIQAGSGTAKGPGSTSSGRPGFRGYDFAREEEGCQTYPCGCQQNTDCCAGYYCKYSYSAQCSRCLRHGVAASADVPQKDVIIEADSLVTKNTGNVALLVEGLIKAGSGTAKGSGSTSRGRPGLR